MKNQRLKNGSFDAICEIFERFRLKSANKLRIWKIYRKKRVFVLFDEKCEFEMNFNLGIGRFKGNFSGEFKGKKDLCIIRLKYRKTLFFQIKSLISSYDFHEFFTVNSLLIAKNA